MCVDKDPAEIADFAALVDEAATLGADWALVFAAALSGTAGRPPTDSQIDAALQRMVEAVKSGDLSGMIPFDRKGEAVQLGSGLRMVHCRTRQIVSRAVESARAKRA